MESIRHYLIIKAPAAKVYAAIVSQTGLASWWTEQVVTDSKTGGFAEFRFGDEYYDKMKIIDLQENKRVEWRCIDGPEEWINTKMIFGLDEKEDESTLRFTHSDWQTATDFFASCNYHWGWFLASLKAYCETGSGKPFKPDK